MTATTIAQKNMMREFNEKFLALMEKYWTPNNSDVYWDNLTADAMELLEQFQTSDSILNEFLSNIVAAFLNSREDIIA